MPVFLEGGIRVRKYQDGEGETHYMHEIHADRVSFLHQSGKMKTKEETETMESEPLAEELPG